MLQDQQGENLGCFKRYMKGADDEILEATTSIPAGRWKMRPSDPPLGERALEMLALQYPQAKQTDPNPLVEPLFMKKIEDSGFNPGVAKEVNAMADSDEILYHKKRARAC